MAHRHQRAERWNDIDQIGTWRRSISTQQPLTVWKVTTESSGDPAVRCHGPETRMAGEKVALKRRLGRLPQVHRSTRPGQPSTASSGCHFGTLTRATPKAPTSPCMPAPHMRVLTRTHVPVHIPLHEYPRKHVLEIMPLHSDPHMYALACMPSHTCHRN